MAAESYRESEIQISSIDQRGRVIAPNVLAAAYQIRARVFRAVEKEFGDLAVAASLLETSAADVSQALRSGSSNHETNGNIRNLEGYLFRSVVRRIDRYKAKQLAAVSCSDKKMLRLERIDPRSELDRHLLIEQLLERCSIFIRAVFQLRTRGYSWDEIGETLRVPPRSASTRYSKALRQLRAEVLHESGEERWTRALAAIRGTNRFPAFSHGRARDQNPPRASQSPSGPQVVQTVATLTRKKGCQSEPFPASEVPTAAGEVPVASTGAKCGGGVN